MNKKILFLFYILSIHGLFARQICLVKENSSFSQKVAKVCAVSKAFLLTNLYKKEGHLVLSPVEMLRPSPSAYSKNPIKPKWQEWP